MLISIIICTRNRCAALKDTLEALSAVAIPESALVEVIVVDNGSTDETSNWLEGATCWGSKIVKVSQPSGGKSAALNSGLATARGAIIVLTDDDVRPAPSWLIELTAPLANEKCDAVAGRVSIAPHLLRPWMRPIHSAWLASTDYLDPNRPETAVGANMAFNRRVLEHVPGFDLELGPGSSGLWEDTLFSLQLVKSGLRLRMACDAVVVHHFDPSRLKRSAFLARGRAEAKSSAYVAWHWRHEENTNGAARLCRYWLHLLAKRTLRWSDFRRDEGIAEWELNLVTGIEYERCYRRERRRTRVYSKFGNRKLVQTPSLS